MKEIKFELKEKSRADKIFLRVTYAGGDADTEHPQDILLKFPYSEWKQNLEAIQKEVETYKILKDLLNINSSKYIKNDYDQVLELYGKEVADLYDNVPGDPQTDFYCKCYLDGVSLIGYTDKGNVYEAYLV